MTYVNEEVLKDDGYSILGGHYREGVVVVRIAYIDENYRAFREDIEEMKLGTMPAFAEAVSIYVDGNKLEIGYIGYRAFDSQFIFATIQNPFLWTGEHVGKVVILLPSGEPMEYEWHFEITW
jgi:riboflavin synthase alpha subunit